MDIIFAIVAGIAIAITLYHFIVTSTDEME